jgi:hypothetical protein
VPGFLNITTGQIDDQFAVLWQVHVAVSAVALPLLVFAIDLVGNRPGTAAPTHEVLIRESFIFPLLTFGLLTTAKVGLDLLWFRSPGVLIMDLIVLAVILVMTVVAFLRSLRLIFSRGELQTKATALIREQMDRIVNASLIQRRANRILIGELQEIGVEYRPFAPGSSSVKHLVTIGLQGTGELTDVALIGLKRVLQALPAQGETLTHDISEPSPQQKKALLGERREPPVMLQKQIGDASSPENAAFRGF